MSRLRMTAPTMLPAASAMAFREKSEVIRIGGILLSFVQSVTAQSAASSASISDFLASPRLNAVALPQAVPRRRASS